MLCSETWSAERGEAINFIVISSFATEAAEKIDGIIIHVSVFYNNDNFIVEAFTCITSTFHCSNELERKEEKKTCLCVWRLFAWQTF